jgi:hypothetical protein
LRRALRSIVLVNVALSPADIARLHRELTAATGIVARARKSFSIPYPVKTPAEYAAEGCILDLDMKLRNNRFHDLAGTGRVFTAQGQMDARQGGPFDQSCEMYHCATLPADATIFRTNNWSFHAWVKPRQIGANTGVVFGQDNVPHYTLGILNSSAYVVSSKNAAGLIRQPNTTAIVKPGRMDHVVTTRELSGADMILRIVVNGVEMVNQVYAGEGVQIPVATQVNIGRCQSTVSTNQFLGALARTRYLANVVTTTADARKEYLEGARKCLLDARIHSDGSCPVSLAATTTANSPIPGTPFTTYGAGSWSVIEEAPSGGRPGKRWLVASAGNTAFADDLSSPFGSWHIKFKTGSIANLGQYIIVCAGAKSASNASIQGYAVLILSSGAIRLYRESTTLFTTADGLISVNTEYEFWLTRTVAGVFTLWAKGGIWATWTLVPAAANPTAADLTYTTCRYTGVGRVAATDTKHQGPVHYPGEMLPSEAIPRGLIDP